MDIDSPWLFEGESSLLVTGVDVAPVVEADFNRRIPGRGERRAAEPDGLRAAWAVLERMWATTLERVTAMPAGTVDVSVDGEVAMVRDFVATVTSDQLAVTRKNPWAPEHPETILSSPHVILEEEWEHHRYAVRDLDAIEARSDG